jgi:exosortase H (IPTLxxWG-CTERM-specific)
MKPELSPSPDSRADAPVRWIPVWRFLTVFGVLLGAYYALILLPASDRALYEYLRINARLANAILNALGQITQVDETTIRSADMSVSVRRGCDAIEPAWFFCAAVLAFPAPWRRKWFPLIAGTAVVLALNLARIVSLFLIGRWWPRFFPMAHLELWPAAFIVTAVLLWLWWIRSTLPEKSAPSHAAT